MKKLLCLTLLFCLCLNLVLAEESQIYTSGQFSYTLDDDGNARITAYTGAAPAVAVPAELDGHSVTAIDEGAFAELDVSIVNLPESVTEIGDDAFRDCTKLVSVFLPEGLETIGKAAFRGCVSMRVLILPANIIRIRSNAFFGCESLSTIELPETLTEISGNLFNGCTA